ncbi:MAG: SagB/ThcOx family dehydrogenase [Candidatus Methanofastidiosum sp.]|nr:SagB/ThcOx family dehydrogenase [Methanofastidiosum sp.]
MIKLNDPIDGEESLESILYKRKSVRSFKSSRISFQQLSNLLFATYGVRNNGPYKTVPSAGALYPLAIYIAIGKESLEEINAGVYRYVPITNCLELVKEGDTRRSIAINCLGQAFISKAPISIIISANFERMKYKYGNRGIRYTIMEAGHSCQNLELSAISLGLASCPVGAFSDNEIIKTTGLSSYEIPLYVVPIGYEEKG